MALQKTASTPLTAWQSDLASARLLARQTVANIEAPEKLPKAIMAIGHFTNAISKMNAQLKGRCDPWLAGEIKAAGKERETLMIRFKLGSD